MQRERSSRRWDILHVTCHVGPSERSLSSHHPFKLLEVASGFHLTDCESQNGDGAFTACPAFSFAASSAHADRIGPAMIASRQKQVPGVG